MHAIGVESEGPTWAEEQEAHLALYRLEDAWRQLEHEWLALEDSEGEHYSTVTGEILSRAEILADQEAYRVWPIDQRAAVEPLVRWCQNEAYRAEIHGAMARRYRQVADRLERRVRAAKNRGSRLRMLLARYLRVLGKQRLATGGVAYVQDRPQLVVDESIADTIPDEWWELKRRLKQREILRAHAKGEPIPLACAVVDMPMVVIRD